MDLALSLKKATVPFRISMLRLKSRSDWSARSEVRRPLGVGPFLMDRCKIEFFSRRNQGRENIFTKSFLVKIGGASGKYEIQF